MIRGNAFTFWQSEVVTVAFGDAYEDVAVATMLTPAEPESIDYEVIRSSAPAVVYHDASSTRTPWVKGRISLRCDVSNAVVVLRLSIRADREAPYVAWTQSYIPNEPTASTTTTELSEGCVYNTHVNADAAIAWSKISKSGSSLADLSSRSAANLSDESTLARRTTANTFSANQTIGAYDFTVDSGTFYVDATNNRIGVKQGTPLWTVDLLEGTGEPGRALRVQYNAASNPLTVGVTRSAQDPWVGWNAAQDAAGDGQTRQIVGAAGRIRLESTGLTLRVAGSDTAGSAISWPEGPAVTSGVLGATANYAVDLGTSAKRFRSLYAGELKVESIVAQETVATMGGRLIVGTTTVLVEDAGSSDTHIHVRLNSFSSGDVVSLTSGTTIEFLAITSSASGSSGNYTYSVTRDLDGSGANDWTAGTAVFSTKPSWIDLTASGPSIVGYVRTDTDYDDYAARWALGNLNGFYGYTGTTWGAGFGDHDNVWLTVNATDGVVAKKGATTRFALNIDGSGSLANSYVTWDTSGNLTVEGSAAIAGWTVATTTLSKNNVVLSSDGWIGLGGADAYGESGAWIGIDTVPKLSLYADAANFLKWDGSKLLIKAANTALDSSGNLTASSATLSGAITATSGTIGGFTVSSSELYAGTGVTRVEMQAAGGFWAGATAQVDAPFSVTVAGLLKATSGTVAGWTLSAAALSGGNVSLDSAGSLTAGTTNDVAVVSAVDTTYRFWAGHATAASAPFRVTKAGTVTATSGTVGGWTLGATALSAGSGATTVGLDTGGTNPAIYAGSATPGSAPFQVTSTGEVTMTSGTITSEDGKVEFSLSNGRIVFDNGSYMKVTGTGFGVSDQFIEWYGQSGDIAACDTTNAVYYLTVGGDAYFGGTLLAGVLYNATQGTVLDGTNTATLGDFASNGGTVTVGWSWNYSYYKTYAPGTLASWTAANRSAPSSALKLEKSTNGGSSWTTLWQDRVVNGTCTAEPPNGEPGFIRKSANGSGTSLDSGTETTRMYRLSFYSQSNVTYGTGTTSNTLGLTSTEE